MNKKLIVALVLVGVLAVTVIGLVSAQALTATPSGTSTTGALTGGFFGWMGRMMGFRGSSYYETGTAIQGQPENITVTNPNTGTTTNYQGYYGYGGCMGGFYP